MVCLICIWSFCERCTRMKLGIVQISLSSWISFQKWNTVKSVCHLQDALCFFAWTSISCKFRVVRFLCCWLLEYRSILAGYLLIRLFLIVCFVKCLRSNSSLQNVWLKAYQSELHTKDEFSRISETSLLKKSLNLSLLLRSSYSVLTIDFSSSCLVLMV